MFPVVGFCGQKDNFLDNLLLIRQLIADFCSRLLKPGAEENVVNKQRKKIFVLKKEKKCMYINLELNINIQHSVKEMLQKVGDFMKGR